MKQWIDTGWHTHLEGNDPFRYWIETKGSLTDRLESLSPHFQITVLFQGAQPPLQDQQEWLDWPQHQPARVREVLLKDGATTWVYAHSMTTLSAVEGPWNSLLHLKNRPLKEALFSDPQVHQQSLRFFHIQKEHPLYQRVLQHIGHEYDHWPFSLMARRAIFIKNKTPLLVTEVFMPSLALAVAPIK